MELASEGLAKRLNWLRALIGAIVTEVALMGVVWLAGIAGDQAAILAVVFLPAAFLVFVPAGYWAARPSPGAALINGMLPAFIGTVLYVIYTAYEAQRGAIVFADTLAPANLLGHAVKFAGGALGGWLAARKAA